MVSVALITANRLVASYSIKHKRAHTWALLLKVECRRAAFFNYVQLLIKESNATPHSLFVIEAFEHRNPTTCLLYICIVEGENHFHFQSVRHLKASLSIPWRESVGGPFLISNDDIFCLMALRFFFAKLFFGFCKNFFHLRSASHQ